MIGDDIELFGNGDKKTDNSKHDQDDEDDGSDVLPFGLTWSDLEEVEKAENTQLTSK